MNKRAKATKESSKPIMESPGDGSDKENEGKSSQDTEKKDVIWYVIDYGALNTTDNSFPHGFIRWADVANFYLTDKLITSIEENIRYQQAFGFKRGDVAGITSGGKLMIQMCHEIMRVLFPEVDPKIIHNKLGNSVKNRIHAYVYPLVQIYR
jgi:hypothetical protein